MKSMEILLLILKATSLILHVVDKANSGWFFWKKLTRKPTVVSNTSLEVTHRKPSVISQVVQVSFLTTLKFSNKTYGSNFLLPTKISLSCRPELTSAKNLRRNSKADKKGPLLKVWFWDMLTRFLMSDK
jgi:hypothetical protein